MLQAPALLLPLTFAPAQLPVDKVEKKDDKPLHAKLIDSDEFRYSPELLHEWKRLAMDHARDTIEKPNKLAGRPNYKRWIRVLVPPVAICALLAAVILPNGSFGLTPTEKKAQAMEAHLEKYKEFMATHKGIILAQFVVMDKINDLKSWEHAKANGSLKALASLIEKQSSLLATKEAVELFSGMELVVPCLKDLERLPEVDKQEEAYRSWRQTVDAMPIKGPQTDAQVKEWTEKVRVLLFACLNWNTASVKSVEGAIRKCIAELK